jgi:two-component system osmolarity sensor histidine kinase EnvZ
VTLWPRSLFGRLALLLIAVVAIGTLATFLVFRQDRAALLERQFGETKIVQLQALRAALEATDGGARREQLARLGREYGVRIVPEAERPNIGGMPTPPHLEVVAARLREALGPATEIRVAPGRGLLFVLLDAGGTGYWVAFPFQPVPPGADPPTRALAWTLSILALLLVAAFAFARYLARPLRELDAAVARVGRGETPEPLPESGPSEISAVNRGFNAMLGNLRQNERDRAVLLAGVSHDLRTPLARLRLGVELGGGDASSKAGMVADIEEMDRIIGQFLDFARGDDETTREPVALDTLVEGVVARYQGAGKDVRFVPGAGTPLPLRATAISRLVANLVDNALAYGGSPVEITTRQEGSGAVLDVMDRGPGIAPGDVERLKQPFTRSSTARARADGAAGAGLGLAIVERVARLHGGRFDLLAREGGGTVARVTLPMGR